MTDKTKTDDETASPLQNGVIINSCNWFKKDFDANASNLEMILKLIFVFISGTVSGWSLHSEYIYSMLVK